MGRAFFSSFLKERSKELLRRGALAPRWPGAGRGPGSREGNLAQGQGFLTLFLPPTAVLFRRGALAPRWPGAGRGPGSREGNLAQGQGFLALFLPPAAVPFSPRGTRPSLAWRRPRPRQSRREPGSGPGLSRAISPACCRAVFAAGHSPLAGLAQAAARAAAKGVWLRVRAFSRYFSHSLPCRFAVGRSPTSAAPAAWAAPACPRTACGGR